MAANLSSGVIRISSRVVSAFGIAWRGAFAKMAARARGVGTACKLDLAAMRFAFAPVSPTCSP